MLVHQGTVEEGEGLLRKLWPEAAAISDPERTLFRAFGLGRGSWKALIGPANWGAGLRALFKGHFVGKPVGDPLVMPGLFLVEGDRVHWSHAFDYAGDHPPMDTLVQNVQGALARA